MKKMMGLVLAIAAMFGVGARAQDVTGQWQGTLHAGKDLRIIVKITEDDGRLHATMYSIDQGAQFKATSVVKQGSEIKILIDVIGGVFDGKVSEDGKTMSGTWTQGPKPLDLVLVKTTPETAWEIPALPAPPKMLPADADPSFAVATIKPNPSGGTSMQRLTTDGHNFVVRNGSLGDLISFAYDVQTKQIIAGPSWMDQDRFDIDARQDVDGLASAKQLRTMVRKLIEDRFELKTHADKRELAAFVLTVGKGGQKLTPTQIKGPLPGMGFRPTPGGLMLAVNNGTLDEFTEFLQSTVLDRPVVNHTGVEGRFDLGVKFTPDDSQFHGHPPKLPEDTTATEIQPSLFDAVQQQLGLKLSAEKTAVDVIVIDHVEKPSAN